MIEHATDVLDEGLLAPQMILEDSLLCWRLIFEQCRSIAGQFWVFHNYYGASHSPHADAQIDLPTQLLSHSLSLILAMLLLDLGGPTKHHIGSSTNCHYDGVTKPPATIQTRPWWAILLKLCSTLKSVLPIWSNKPIHTKLLCTVGEHCAINCNTCSNLDSAGHLGTWTKSWWERLSK